MTPGQFPREITCARHLCSNIVGQAEKSGANKQQMKAIKNDVFNLERGLFSCQSPMAFEKKFDEFEEKYGEYFSERYLNDIRTVIWKESIEPSLDFESIPSSWKSNRVSLRTWKTGLSKEFSSFA